MASMGELGLPEKADLIEATEDELSMLIDSKLKEGLQSYEIARLLMRELENVIMRLIVETGIK